MNDPGFGPEQLSELWYQIIDEQHTPGGSRLQTLSARLDSWDAGIEAMYRRCETYPQHAKLVVTVAALPKGARHNPDEVRDRGDKLLEQATTEQILQALKYERQRLEEQPIISSHVLTQAIREELTLAWQVVEQLPWDDRLLTWAAAATAGTVEHDAWLRLVEVIQQHLLGGNENAWSMFLGIVEDGTLIGEAAALANAIEHQHRPTRHRA